MTKIAVDIAEEVKSIPLKFREFLYLEEFSDPNYDPRVFSYGGEDEAVRFGVRTREWLKMQLHDLYSSVLSGNQEEAHNYFRRKVGEVDEVIREVREIENKIVKSHLPVVSSVLRYRISRASLDFLSRAGHDAADLIAEASIGIYDALRKFDPRSSYEFSTCVRNNALNKVLNLLRKTKAKKRLDPNKRINDFANEDGEVITNSSIDLIRTERVGYDSPVLEDVFARENSALSLALKKISRRRRNVIESKYGIGRNKLTNKEMARKLGLGVGKVASIQEDAMRRVEIEIDPEGYYSRHLAGIGRSEVFLRERRLYELLGINGKRDEIPERQRFNLGKRQKEVLSRDNMLGGKLDRDLCILRGRIANYVKEPSRDIQMSVAITRLPDTHLAILRAFYKLFQGNGAPVIFDFSLNSNKAKKLEYDALDRLSMALDPFQYYQSHHRDSSRREIFRNKRPLYEMMRKCGDLEKIPSLRGKSKKS